MSLCRAEWQGRRKRRQKNCWASSPEVPKRGEIRQPNEAGRLDSLVAKSADWINGDGAHCGNQGSEKRDREQQQGYG